MKNSISALLIAAILATTGCTTSPTANLSVQPVALCTPEDAAATSIEDFDSCAIYYKAQNELLDILASLEPAEAPITLHADPAVDKTWLDGELARINDAYTFWKPYFQPKEVTEIYWLMDTPEQLEWANSIFQPLQDGFNNGESINALDPDRCEASNSSDYARINWDTKKVIKHVYVTNTCADMSSNENAFRPVHEYAHLAQYSYNIPQNAPLWFTEGSADYFGQILGNAKISEDKLSIHRQYFSNSMPSLAFLSEEAWATKIEELSGPFGDGWQAYAVGGYLTELLIGVYGFEKFEKFMTTFKSAPNLRIGEKPAGIEFFNKNFEKTYGISTEAFYKAGYRYVQEIAALYPPQ